MKGLLFWLIILLAKPSIKAQILDPFVWKWFELDNFFDKRDLVEERIEAIHIKIDEKKDGEIIREKGDFLHYEFDLQGNLTKSLKSVKLAMRIDTLQNIYRYDQDGLLQEKEEIHPPFHFSFHYQYTQRQPTKEIKIDENSSKKDTVHQHFYSYKKQENSIIKEISYDANGQTFKKERTQKGEAGRIESHKLSYSRGGAYQHTTFHYENDLLKKVRFVSQFSVKTERFKQFFYKNGKLNDILLFEDGKRTKKMALTYKKNGLIEALIERDFEAKQIKIYYFLYSKLK